MTRSGRCWGWERSDARWAQSTARDQLATIELKVQGIVRVLERRYRPNQPRAPAGAPEGGQWVDDTGGGRNSETRRRIAQLTPFGVLVDQIRLNDSSRLCIYDLGAQQWVIEYGPTLQIGCPGILHQSGIFSRGRRLNDNPRK